MNTFQKKPDDIEILLSELGEEIQPTKKTRVKTFLKTRKVLFSHILSHLTPVFSMKKLFPYGSIAVLGMLALLIIPRTLGQHENTSVNQITPPSTSSIESKQDITNTAPIMNEAMDYSLTQSAESLRQYSGNQESAVGTTETENYAHTDENEFIQTSEKNTSTFSIDVDTASYSNIRRYITNGQTPPPDAVRIEEMLNSFEYNYPTPSGDLPFTLSAEISATPWNSQTHLVHLGVQAKSLDTSEIPDSNLVFLLDVSGSMDSPDKLPLLKKSFELLLSALNPDDRVAIVVYAGSSGIVLNSTPVSKSAQILDAIYSLNPGGSTAGSEGIELAYKIAKDNFIHGGNNRIILATDGDFNVGPSSEEALEELIESKRKDGIFLSVLGFGTGNLQDSKMEILADKGNGNYAYIDSELEAKKVLVTEIGGTLHTIAKDVKIQVEFNPDIVSEYRLIGYENRMLQNEQFEDDTIDAGELGEGHTVTALYEVILSDNSQSKNMFDLALRYKKPNEDTSKLVEAHYTSDNIFDFDKTSDDFRFAAAVAEFGLILSESKYQANASLTQVTNLAKNALGDDPNGYRQDFVKLVEQYMNSID